MKKVLAVIMCIVMVFTMSAIGVSAKKAEKELQFNSDGSFKIMQVSDLQDDMTLNPIAKDFIKAALIKENPDLIVLTGDNIAGYKCSSGFSPAIDRALCKKGIKEYMSIFEDYGKPVAMVFGNHDDDDNLVTKEELLQMYDKYSCFVGYDDAPEIYGCGTYNLPILSSDGTKTAYNLWMFDSNTYDEVYGGYDFVHDDQVDWYINKSNELKRANGGVPVDSMAFQHIIVKEIWNTIEPCQATDEGAYYFGEKLGYQRIKPSMYKAGNFKEWPCPGTQDSKQFTAMLSQGDVRAMFFGHDHNNTFELTYQGIDLVATPGFTYNSYSNEDRGFRIINLNENDTSTYETHILQWQDIYGDSWIAMNHYNMYAKEGEISGWDKFVAGLSYCLVHCIKSLFGYVF
ncbi:MAG: metallophosphoesterase [Ruminococcus sp.]|nr:metallophosphoesterase [Candidatus Copronaster equi]